MKPNRSFKMGNTIPEYVLPALLVLALSITSLQLFGKNFNGLFSSLQGDMQQSIQTTASAKEKQVKALAAFDQAAADGAFPSGNPPSKLCDAQGNCISVGSAMDMKSTIETVGANGTIKVMADKLKLLGAYLLANHQITPEQAGIFNDLANQSYKIGVISGLVEQTAKTCGANADCFNGTRVSYNGQMASMKDLSGLIGYIPLSASDPSQTQNSPEVDTLWNIFKGLPNEVWNNPELKSTVLTLTTQIGQTSNLVMWGTSNIQNGYMSPNGMHDYIVGQAQGTIPESAVAQGATAQGSINTDATNICTSGKGQSDGASCK